MWKCKLKFKDACFVGDSFFPFFLEAQLLPYCISFLRLSNRPSWASATTVLWTETFLVYLLSSTSLLITELTRSSKCTFNLAKCNWRLTHASPSTYPHSDPQTPFFFFSFSPTALIYKYWIWKWILVENAEQNVLKVANCNYFLVLQFQGWLFLFTNLLTFLWSIPTPTEGIMVCTFTVHW